MLTLLSHDFPFRPILQMNSPVEHLGRPCRANRARPEAQRREARDTLIAKPSLAGKDPNPLLAVLGY